MFCPAGSVHGHLSVYACTGAGIERDSLQLGTRAGRSYAWLTHSGRETEYDSAEVQRIRERAAGGNAG